MAVQSSSQVCVGGQVTGRWIDIKGILGQWSESLQGSVTGRSNPKGCVSRLGEGKSKDSRQ